MEQEEIEERFYQSLRVSEETKNDLRGIAQEASWTRMMLICLLVERAVARATELTAPAFENRIEDCNALITEHVEAEREECIKIAQSEIDCHGKDQSAWHSAHRILAQIRHRNKPPKEEASTGRHGED